ncbi:hypothetical protein [Nocardia farcinica]|uniref:Uncharacterized protein n=1 Tax=Nocardia farcinica (strain IFM 10152) TaxID=247156 RepID=Q5YSJ1_NOCFA|nr:hypothetical protein [Nocardia farcinica]BAD58850.1 hypothetical protein NFA_40020 [Nocardia farcinica IFM 10152]
MMTTTTATTQERIIDTRFSYYNDNCIHVMRLDFEGEAFFYAVNKELTSIGPTRSNRVSALLDGRHYLGRFRPACYCVSDAACTCVQAQVWRRYQTAHPNAGADS